MGEHHLDTVGVQGSNPCVPTISLMMKALLKGHHHGVPFLWSDAGTFMTGAGFNIYAFMSLIILINMFYAVACRFENLGSFVIKLFKRKGVYAAVHQLKCERGKTYYGTNQS